MSTIQPDPVLQAVADAAVRAAGAVQARIIARRDGDLQIVATGGTGSTDAIGSLVSWDEDPLGYVVASGQPMSLDDDERPPGLCVPCTAASGVIGALELSGAAAGGASFDVAAIETATLLAGIAAAVLTGTGWQARSVMSPAEIGGELERLRAADAARYGTVASLIAVLLAHG
jgi:hypothetical protein